MTRFQSFVTAGAALLTLLLAGCGSDSATAPKYSATEVQGTWEMMIAPQTGCFGAAGGGKVYFSVDSSARVLTDSAASVDVVSPWDFTPHTNTFGFLASGHFSLAGRTLELILWKRPLSTGALLTGSLDANGNFAGFLRDPNPGYSPIFVIGSCTFAVTGHRV